tara:strand:- start:2306 stop:2539 length:234 start_codon:yes stop_codon:yes gene_type:complete
MIRYFDAVKHAASTERANTAKRLGGYCTILKTLVTFRGGSTAFSNEIPTLKPFGLNLWSKESEEGEVRIESICNQFD